MNDGRNHSRAIVIGGSSGAAEVLLELLGALPREFPLPLLICQHLHSTDCGRFAQHLGQRSAVEVINPCDKTPIAPGRVYVAPADYHLLVERDRTLALSVDERVRWSRPSIDVLFESAARAYTVGLVGILLSGSNDDGTAGMLAIKQHGGLTIAQAPSTSAAAAMPLSAIEHELATLVLAPDEITDVLLRIHDDPDLSAAKLSKQETAT